MIKLITVVGTRPEIIKLSRIISVVEKYFDHHLVHTGQNYDYELNEIFFKELKIKKPDIYLNSAKKSPLATIGNILISFEKVCKKLKPDAILILGDTNSCLSSIVAKKMRIPIFHMEAGNRCFDKRVPEENNRIIVDHISDINLTYSSIAREYLLKEGINPYTVIKVGSPMKEVINHYIKLANKSRILDKLSLKKNNFYLISFHREENVDDDQILNNFFEIIEYLSKNNKNQIIISTHFRTLKRIKKLNKKFSSNVIISKPLGFLDYLKLQINSKLVISDSGTITEEASILNFSAISLRSSHERPEGLEEGSVIFNDTNLNTFKDALKVIMGQKKMKIKNKIVKDYDVDNVSDKVVKIILSYLDYTNNIILKKNRYIKND